MKTFTIAIATYQRRREVTRLVTSLSADLRRDPALAEGVDLLVVVDGSQDGTLEALAEVDVSVPLEVAWHVNAGLSATRHRSIDVARGEVIWFLDDDVIPAAGTFARHRTAHEDVEDHVVVGPCILPPDAPTVRALRQYYDGLWAELGQRRSVDRFDQFSAANTSAPVRVLRDVGGFDLGFKGYGREDFELGFRLLRAGVGVSFDAAAVAWHHQERTLREFFDNAASEGVNSVHLARLHPETIDQAIPGGRNGRSYRAIARLGIRRPGPLWAVSRLAAAAAVVEARRGERTRLFDLAYAAAFASGVARADPSGKLVARMFTGV